MPIDRYVPSQQQITGWIQEVFDRGVRRPGYPADRWAEEHCLERFRELGLENVRHEPVELPCWEPRAASLRVTAGGQTLDIPCFALPHSTPKAEIEAQLVAFDPGAPERVNGGIALYDVPLLRMRHAMLAGLASWVYDPGATCRDHAGAPVRTGDHGCDGAGDGGGRCGVRGGAVRLSGRFEGLLRAVRRRGPAHSRRLGQRK